MEKEEEIYNRYAETVYKFLLSKTGDHHLAEELTQETFYQAIKNINRFDGKSQISTWLCAIAKNQLSSYRKKHPDFLELSELSDYAESAEDTVISAQNKVELFKMLHHCPEPYREIMYLRIYGTLSFKEIGEIMNQSETWARVNYYRGKEKLRKDLMNNEE